MKRNIKKVIKCLACLVTCVSVVVCSLVSPVFAVAGGTVYDINVYWFDTEVSGDTLTDYFGFDTLSGSWHTFANNYYVSGVDDIKTTYTVSSGSALNDVDFYYYFMGSGSSNGVMKYNYLSLGNYRSYNTISLGASFDFSMVCHNPPGCDITVKWQCRIKYYDEDMKELGVLTSEESSVLIGDSTSGKTFSTTFDIEIPSGACYLVPYLWLSVDPALNVISTDMTIRADRTSPLYIMVTSPSNLSDEDIAEGELDDANGKLEDTGDHIGDAIGDYNDINSQLPSAPSDFSDVVDDDQLNNAINDAQKIFDWDKSGLNFMFAPMTLSLGLAVLFYVVFGKGD